MKVRITDWIRDDIESREIEDAHTVYAKVVARVSATKSIELTDDEAAELLDDADYQSDPSSGFEDRARSNAYGALKKQILKARKVEG